MTGALYGSAKRKRLAELMRIIIENLDVQNLFKAVYKREEIKDPIEMSEECKANLVNYIK